jgi:hypothetical protein
MLCASYWFLTSLILHVFMLAIVQQWSLYYPDFLRQNCLGSIFLVGNDKILWSNLDVAEIGHAIIFLLKILNFVVSRYNNI